MSILNRAAKASANARNIASDLHKQGRDHFNDPTWREAMKDVNSAFDAAYEAGYDHQDIGDAASRIR
ncbi:hypothetical protein K7472_18435 [Streptomyces sp. PTM05]|uniref:Uncharacterized protein n=1 Tax=Streptantibioticus parmotrematis TaxID=2873249 RepID=A0ABS7QYG2_9ACTN|nr:hypothetical protein [Streptantibioticus parmotrematis]MBY8886829.1 hypothetical protein [Streptantibioticus parmotrematis]